MEYWRLLQIMGSRMARTAEYLRELADRPERQEEDMESEFLARILQDFEDHAEEEDFDKEEEFEKIRHLVDELPETVDADRVNRLQKVTHRVSDRLFDPEASFVGPNRAPAPSGGHTHVSHRGEQETVRIEGRLYTPIYMAVVADAVKEGGAAPEHKDFEQTESGQVLIHTGGSGTQNALWISIGRPLRQVRWVELYGKKDHLNPLIHSFLVPLETANAISRETLTEIGTSKDSVDINVDKHFEMNQTGIRRPESLELLGRQALPGSLRTYYDDTQIKREDVKPYWGDARPLRELKDKLGVPLREMRGFGVFTRKTVDGGKTAVGFTPKKDYKSMADILTDIYEQYRKGVTEGVVPEEVVQFCLDHHPEPPGPADMPDGFGSSQGGSSGNASTVSVSREVLEDFMEHVVAPWATHARIMEAVAEDYELLLADEQLPEIAPDIRFSPNPSTRGMTGQRRPGHGVQAREQAAWMDRRSQFLDGVREAAGILRSGGKGAEGGKKKDGAVLKDIGILLKEAQDDYRFVVGDVVEIRDRLTDFARRLSEVLETAIASEVYSEAETVRLRELRKRADGLTAETLTDVQSEHALAAPGMASGDGQKPPVRQNQLYLNQTRGGGNCFYHALYESIHGVRSDLATQQQMRQEIADALAHSPKVIASHFGTDAVAYQRFRREILTEGTWVPDIGPAVIADALNRRITIYAPGGMLYYDARPNPSLTGQVSVADAATVSYDGVHYNSVTRERLKEQPKKQSGSPSREQGERQPERSRSSQAQSGLAQSSSPKSSSQSGSSDEEEKPLKLNPTLGDGNCFFHALYESLHGVRSDLATQQQMREEILDALIRSPEVIASHFGNDTEAYQQFGEEILTEGTWVPDMGPAIIADALNIRITINRPDGTLYFDAVPNPAVTGQEAPAATVTVAYAHDHYRSMTREALQAQPERQAESKDKKPPEEKSGRQTEERGEKPPEKEPEKQPEREPEKQSEKQPERQSEKQPEAQEEEKLSERPRQGLRRSLSLNDLASISAPKESPKPPSTTSSQSAALGSPGGNKKTGKR